MKTFSLHESIEGMLQRLKDGQNSDVKGAFL